MHSIQTAKAFDLIFVLTCWNDSQERSVKSLRPAESLQKEHNYKHFRQTELTEAGGGVHQSRGLFFSARGFGFTFPFWNKIQ